MSLSSEFHIDPPAQDGLSPQGAALAFGRIKPYGRKLLRLPVLRSLYPTAQRVSAVAEPPGRLAMRGLPAAPGVLECRGLTVMSANLWHDWPLYRQAEERLEGFARLVEAHGVELILVQEVARTPGLRVDEWLSERLGMGYIYSRANGHARGIGFEEGLAVFSRYPLERPRLRHLGARSNPFVRRLALGAQVHTPCGDVLALSIHLGLNRSQNAAQLRDLRTWVASLEQGIPVVIGGDFNAGETSSQIRQAQTEWVDAFRVANPHADGTTHVLRWPWGGVMQRSRLDYIFLNQGPKPWNVLHADHLQTTEVAHSDHHAVLAKFAPTPQLS